MMTTEQTLIERSGGKCELCGSEAGLSAYEVAGSDTTGADAHVLLCDVCRGQISEPDSVDVNHWRCLNDSMWNPVPAVQVISWRMLKQLSAESWAQDLLEMLYLEDDVRQWAEAGAASHSDDSPPTLDSNGAVLSQGDTVTLIKDLVVKGANFTAKRGTAVRNIALTDNPEQIEGKVNGVRIVLLTQYLKKAN